ncbi:MAG: DUF1549 domain-containing protein, partial [Verrucomicrobiae bacterium]|nr:DUF1549 domain-containing protein [Verrucomicrobiae bacterium]
MVAPLLEKFRRMRFVAAIVTGCLPVVAADPEAGGGVQFNRDIRPLLSENCLACHGPDPGSRKAGLRLDTREGLFGGTKNEGSVVAPGKPEESALWKRVVHSDPDELMPPPDSHKELKPEQRERIRQWIAQGALWQPHWSFIPPVRPAIPRRGADAPQEPNPLDAFIAANLASRGLAMNPETDRRTLARRLSLDLTGLPPKPAEV